MDIQSTKFVNLKFENSIAAPKFTNFNLFRFNQIHTNPFVTTAAINRRRLIRPITNVEIYRMNPPQFVQSTPKFCLCDHITVCQNDDQNVPS